MRRSRYPEMTDEQFEDLIGGLPRREPPPGLRDRVLAHARPRRASLLRARFALAALVLLAALDVGVLRWQDSVATPPSLPSSLPPFLAQNTEKRDDDLLLLVPETYRGRAWPLLLAHRPPRPESYLQLRNRLLNATDRG